VGEQRVKLVREWTIGERLGSGGFGSVFEAVAEDGEVGVVKLIPKAPGANRELLFEELTGVPNVVPIIEVGETPDAYALAMPRAEKSLRQAMHVGIPVPLADALNALRDIARAIEALDGKVVHRDIKPENVLLLNGEWCLADFGIARFAEASTAPDTQKYAWSAPYASPERWRGERASSAADVYSVGVVAYELLVGGLPFAGPDTADYRNQHLTAVPAPLGGAPTALANLVGECLFKAPGARPTPSNLRRRIGAIAQPSSAAVAKLQQANAAAAESAGRAMTAAELARLEAERRKDLLRAAEASFLTLRDDLGQRVIEQASQAGSDFPFRLNTAELRLEGPFPVKDGEFAYPGFEAGFEVVAFGQVVVSMGTATDPYRGRAHSLWFCDAQQPQVFRWYECAWMYHAFIPRKYAMAPTALPPSRDTFAALSPVTDTHQLAWPFTPVDQGDSADFIERWLVWFGEAALGQMHHPRQMPERETRGSFRVAKSAASSGELGWPSSGQLRR
jgi:eukaryotic-like serine/threonine-protein kinase